MVTAVNSMQWCSDSLVSLQSKDGKLHCYSTYVPYTVTVATIPDVVLVGDVEGVVLGIILTLPSKFGSLPISELLFPKMAKV